MCNQDALNATARDDGDAYTDEQLKAVFNSAAPSPKMESDRQKFNASAGQRVTCAKLL